MVAYQSTNINSEVKTMRKIAARLIGAIESSPKPVDPNLPLAPKEPDQPESGYQNSPEAFYQRMLDRDIYLHISDISVGMIGVCLTGVSILQGDDDSAASYVDELLALDSFVFLTSYLLAYWSVRVAIKGNRYVRRVASIANLIFLFGMVVMAIVCGCIAVQGDYSFGLSPQK
jgi:hypothetical protein